mgnify:FL=1
MTKVLIASIFLILMVALPVSAQDRPMTIFDMAPYAAVVAGNVADLQTTKAAFARGAHEGNGFTATTNILPIAAAKISFMAGTMLAMRALETHGHPRWAKVIGYVDGGATFLAAWHNRGVK